MRAVKKTNPTFRLNLILYTKILGEPILPLRFILFHKREDNHIQTLYHSLNLGRQSRNRQHGFGKIQEERGAGQYVDER